MRLRFDIVGCVAALALAAVTTETAYAQWTVVNLHPAGATYSEARGVSDTQQTGWARFGSHERAGMWTGTGASWVELHPAASVASEAHGVSGTQQVGRAVVSSAYHASLWSGTAASWEDMNPAGAASSEAYGGTGTHQVGMARVGGVTRASLWSGTASSWTDLHPAAASSSEARGVFGAQQAGAAAIDGLYHASLWSGTAASWVDLHPAGPWFFSIANATSGTQQVGLVYSTMSATYASLWSGTAASWVDLNPSGAFASEAFGAFGALQVGDASVGGVPGASLWSGTAASWVDLHQYLPGGPGAWDRSHAQGVWTDGSAIYVVGYGFHHARFRGEALMWVYTPPSCPADFNGDGFVNGDDYDSFAELFDIADPGADFNGDGFVNGDDYDAFASAFDGGC